MIIVLVEIEQGAPAEVSLETVAFARSLSEAGGGVPIDAVVVGDLGDSASALAAYGVRRVYQAVGDDFGSFGGGAWASALLAAREAAGAVVVTAAGTNRGNEALAHVAARLDAPMAANVIAFASLAPFTVTRQVVGERRGRNSSSGCARRSSRSRVTRWRQSLRLLQVRPRWSP